ncbi:MAG: hypothetical protein A2374_04455 [Candidatus Moranbacteria bacterium RIFOXYB1_FULL_44_23]|nr:MAG: Methicillin resistance protein [Candidatus Moranbacteria bacterium GW2011_GWF2_44_10]KKT71929.1 MAG: Methicillin resistance protein [Candidatus Moranbacteria bacterium GW2011_GWF1_44_4]OGI24116.1 MAG: hypothetical protein A2194_02270 [Candidatus Moranbacteria bacterium RIFOXYA1_FULL_44_8]OGI35659.1 MAG: hypothetical protein A2407_02010 [Candidatus Moranbacteria bacterium RIFOXYC1_FULL_44_8]OGI39165.1 MAG: hypothetical protein A2374_04455 [Candidatus Moranbacteria bacterium RIFOXYB1_FULL
MIFMNDKSLNFVQANSPDGSFLQSDHWRKFQESVGRKTHNISASDGEGEILVHASIITHGLPIVGDYFYVPRGPVIKIFNFQFSIFKQFLNDLIGIVQKNNAGWVRIEPNSEEELKLVRENLSSDIKIKKAPVDVQPKESLILDISKNEDELLARMKQKTRYNIKLAKKKNIVVHSSRQEKYIDEFCRLVKITAGRDKITSHPENYYRKMFETIPGDILKLYIAEYNGKVIAANLVLFFGKTATYLHGASDNIHREVMAPYLLQWQQIIDAKKAGCERYDFGGVKVEDTGGRSWAGVTKFKTGFASGVEPIQFPGCWDIVMNPGKYRLYKVLQKIKRLL